MTTVHTIGIAGDKQLSIPQYIKIIKTAKSNPEGIFQQSFCRWWPSTGKVIVKEWLDAIDDRINRRNPNYPTGKKAQPMYQTELMRDYRAYVGNRDRRIIVRQWNTNIFKNRLAHLLFVDD
jgi:hypothetical protein